MLQVKLASSGGLYVALKHKLLEILIIDINRYSSCIEIPGIRCVHHGLSLASDLLTKSAASFFFFGKKKSVACPERGGDGINVSYHVPR